MAKAPHKMPPQNKDTITTQADNKPPTEPIKTTPTTPATPTKHTFKVTHR